MSTPQYFKNKVLQIAPNSFNDLALELFQYQAQHNHVYGQYIKYLKINIAQVQRVEDIPFLPIQFFKSHQVSVYPKAASTIFTSSGTTGKQTSRHHVYDENFYQQVCQKAFEDQFGPVADYCVFGLLPSYLERSGSSLIHMVQYFIGLSADADSGFYLNNLSALSQLLSTKRQNNKKVLLIGVTFALLDLAELHPQNLAGITLMETGGMKGRRKEMVRNQVHVILKKAFNLSEVQSEYGMTELLSQAYSPGQGVFNLPPWVQFSIRQSDDPFSAAKKNKTGGLNVIDLANVESCAFIETQDLAREVAPGRFEIMGRFDAADIRGCNLLVI